MAEQLTRLSSILSAREMNVIRLRIRMGHTQEEAAAVIGLSQRRVSQIEQEALDKLREACSKLDIKNWDFDF